MRKPDDDLKIDISELFGGDLPSPSEKLEEADSISTASDLSQNQKPSPPDGESQFQEWMSNRNAELEVKSQELERQFQEQYPTANPEPAPSDTFKVSELLPTPTPMDPTPTQESPAPIDFNAPIAPPFMGGGTVPTATVTSETPSSSGSEGNPGLNADELKKLQAEYEFLMLYDEFRNIIAYELKDLVGSKKTYTMLGRTVELAREKYPQIFRNANWDSAGNLLEDGSVDSQRIIENKNALNPKQANAIIDAALLTLLKLRLQAVEKGLGAGLKNKVRARLYKWISDKTQQTQQEGKDATTLKRLGSYLAST